MSRCIYKSGKKEKDEEEGRIGKEGFVCDFVWRGAIWGWGGERVVLAIDIPQVRILQIKLKNFAKLSINLIGEDHVYPSSIFYFVDMKSS